MCAEGAALGTQTTFESEVIGGVYNILPNETLQRMVYEELNCGGVFYNEEERDYAEKIQATLIIKKSLTLQRLYHPSL